MRDAGGDSGSAVTSITTPTPEVSQLWLRSATNSSETSHIARPTPASRASVPASSSPISREQPAASAEGVAAGRRSTLAPLNHVLRDPAGAVCSASRHHSTADRGSSRRGSFLPSTCLFLQKGGNGSRTSGQHYCRPWKTKPFPESFCFVASTEPPALLEKGNHLARESLQPLGVNVHKHVEAVGRTLVDPLLHKVDNLLRGADEPIMSTTPSGDNLTNGD